MQRKHSVWIPNFYGFFRYNFQEKLCLRALVNPSPKGGPTDKNGMPLICRQVKIFFFSNIILVIYFTIFQIKSEWSKSHEVIFACYRVMIFFWMIFGISFSMTIVSISKWLKGKKIFSTANEFKSSQKTFSSSINVQISPRKISRSFCSRQTWNIDTQGC